MLKKYTKIMLAFLTVFAVVVSSSSVTEASTDSMLDVGVVRSLGETATLPITLRNTKYLTSGQLSISLPSDSKGVSLVSFEPGDLFDGEAFRTKGNINGNKITIDFISQTGAEQQLRDYKADEAVVIGYITYNLSEQFLPGQSVPLEITNVVATGRDNEELTVQLLNGKIEHRMLVGDVIGSNKVTATGAMRVLQHINGDFITDREQFLSADVDADGVLTQNDALQILDYATGKRTTFLAVAAKEMNIGVLNSEYNETIEARHGREPYQFERKSGSMPSGLTLNEETGELTGMPKKAGEFTFVVQVTDAVGNGAERKFTINIIDSNIILVEKIEPINVKRGETPNLPSQVTVTYKDKTTGKESVTWEPVDTSILGAVTAKGTIGDSGFTVHATINVVSENYINNIKIGYFQMLNVHTIVVDTTPNVYVVKVNNIPAHYEGNDQFSLASTSFKEGSSVTLRLYDKYGNLLETKTQKLEIN